MGEMVAAREATVGSKLGESTVSRVSSSYGGIINPLTASGKIMASGLPASTYPEWIADYMLSSYLPLPLSMGNLLSFLFPANTQAYYDAHLEQFFNKASSSLPALTGVAPFAF